MNLLAGSTGFLGNNILKELGFNKSPTIALGRSAVSNLPDDAEELLIDFEMAMRKTHYKLLASRAPVPHTALMIG